MDFDLDKPVYAPVLPQDPKRSFLEMAYRKSGVGDDIAELVVLLIKQVEHDGEEYISGVTGLFGDGGEKERKIRIEELLSSLNAVFEKIA